MVETLTKDLRRTEKKLVLVNPFSQQLSTQVLPPISHPLFLDPSYTFVVVLGMAEKSIKKGQWGHPLGLAWPFRKFVSGLEEQCSIC